MEDEFTDNFDLEEVYNKQILPLLTSIIRICDEHDFPMFAAFQYNSNTEQVDVSTSAVFPPERTAEQMLAAYKVLTEEDMGDNIE